MSEQELNSLEIIRQSLSMQNDYMDRKPDLSQISFLKPKNPCGVQFTSNVLDLYKNVEVRSSKVFKHFTDILIFIL